MGEQDRGERDKFENELKRILKVSDDAGIILRGHRGVGFPKALPKIWISSGSMGRAYTDIDFCRL